MFCEPESPIFSAAFFSIINDKQLFIYNRMSKLHDGTHIIETSVACVSTVMINETIRLALTEQSSQ